MRILLYYQRKELTNESISLSLSHTFPDSSLHSPINADLLSTSPFTVPIFFFLHLSPQVSLSFFLFFFFFAIYMIFSILISRFQCAEKGKEKKGNWKSSNLFFFLFAFPFTEFRYEIIRPVVEGVDWSFDLTFLHFKFNSTHPFKRFTLQINSFHICTSSFVVLG
ncbi:hypothetical protein WN944_019818 [Citrus x changshan-huyou]|uniref:Uncharacterized protein n=1 Tax=Citrus x changshan-huyou TaxID=2935761 RepID=A0AAP0LW77_9ROSI